LSICRGAVDAGHRDILSIIGKIEEQAGHGRSDSEGKYFFDFGFEERLVEERYQLQLDVVSFDKEESYTVLSQFEFHAEVERAWERLGLAEAAMLKEYLLRRCAIEFVETPARVRLRTGQAYRSSFTMRGDVTGMTIFTARTRIRSLGRVPRRAIVFNAGALIQQVCDALGFPADSGPSSDTLA